MAVLLVVTCSVCGAEHRAGHADQARAAGPARARAAVWGWSTTEVRGVTQDVCPACRADALEPAARAVTPAHGLRAVPAPAAPVVHPLRLVAEDAAVCAACEVGDHVWCRRGSCACTVPACGR